MGQMSADLYRSKDESAAEIEALDLISELPEPPDFDRAIKAGSAMGGSNHYARELGFEPSNVMTPTELAIELKAKLARVVGCFSHRAARL